ncbi:MAG: hypothetical protein MJZ68_01235 [archaeon]|nr:hypothetical protein [archaeon]
MTPITDSGTAPVAGAVYTCSICFHRWVARKGAYPKNCPNCRTTLWMKEYHIYKCCRCFHEWGTAREISKRCPKCHSSKWQEPVSNTETVVIDSKCKLGVSDRGKVLDLYNSGTGCISIAVQTGIAFGDVFAAIKEKYPGAQVVL